MKSSLKLKIKVDPEELWHESALESLIFLLVEELKEKYLPLLIKDSTVALQGSVPRGRANDIWQAGEKGISLQFKIVSDTNFDEAVLEDPN